MSLFTNTWPEEEACAEAEYLKELLLEGHNEEYLAKEIVKTRNRWEKIFDDADFLQRYISTYNKLVCQFDSGVTADVSQFLMQE